MLRKKSCPRCGKSSRGNYEFCPHCGNPLEKKKKDFGMLGEKDTSPFNPSELRFPSGIGPLVNSLMRSLENQYKNLERKGEKKEKRGDPFGFGGNGISISISAPGMFPQVNLKDPHREKSNAKKHEEIKKFFSSNFNPEKLSRYSRMPKAEPKTRIRRISNRIVYEVELPGVKSIRDVSIIRLENSMELKALADKKAYAKKVPLDLPIINYRLSKGKLTLEMDVQEN